MPAVNASGDIFSLNGDARYEGIVNARAGAGASLSVSLEAEFCHGYNLEASATTLVDVNAALTMLLAVRGSAFATAAAGLNAKVQFKPDLFERFGVIIDAAAYAEASAGFSLAGGLDFALLAQWGKANPLRTFDDTCVRYLAARKVAADTGTPLARVLALYRIEGNLCVFPSMSSILRGIPSGVLTGREGAWTDARIANVDAHVESTWIHQSLRPNMAHMVWLADDTDAVVQGIDVPAAEKDDHIKNLALASGFLAQAIGCDLLASRSPARSGNALTFAPTEFRPVSTRYWRWTKPDTTEAAKAWQLISSRLPLPGQQSLSKRCLPAAALYLSTTMYSWSDDCNA
jgi:hypothetical protein